MMTIMMMAAALQAASPAAPAASADTVQARFEAASAAFDKGDCAIALDGFTALEQRPAVQKLPRSLTLVRLRRALALECLSRDEEAALLLRAGIAAIAGAPDPNLERPAALLGLARIEERALDYPGARRDYEAALALTPANQLGGRTMALTGVARVAMFDDTKAALDAVDQAIAANAKMSKRLRGELRMVRGRVLLNGGQFNAAKKELLGGVSDLGGLNSRGVDRADVVVRSDLAIAALLDGFPSQAREYLAYTGAGLLKGNFPVVADKTLPQCGEEGVEPSDVTVIQFTIREDGGVSNATPVYASRQGPVALAFARAVADWSWTANEAKAIDPFFRLLTRLELRCSKATNQPSMTRLLFPEVERWLVTKGMVEPLMAGTDVELRTPAARSAVVLRAALADVEKKRGTQHISLFPTLISLVLNPSVPEDDKMAYIARARAIALANDAPASARALIAIWTPIPTLKASKKYPSKKNFNKNSGERVAARSAILNAALADPVVAADAKVVAILRLELLDMNAAAVPAARRVEELRSVADDGRLPEGDPLRVGAYVRLASAEAQQGNLAEARKAYAKTGLSEQQCALVDAQPAFVSSGASSKDFPKEALQWGFTGWVVTEFDIDAAGGTLRPRAIVAYPPFVFEKAAAGVVGKARYQQSYRPASGLGCSASSQSVKFILPGR